MDYNKAFESFVGIGLDDYPGSDYSLIEEYYPVYSKYPNFISRKKLNTPLCGLFEEVEVVTFENLYNRVMSLVAPNFEPAQMLSLQNLVNGLVSIYGGDKKGMLWFLEEEIEEVESGEWAGRDWDYPKYEEVHDILLTLSKEKGLLLIIREKGNLLDFLDD